MYVCFSYPVGVVLLVKDCRMINHSKRRTFWSLNEDILKITILKTNTPYPSRKIRCIRACIHQRPQRNKAQYAVSREAQYPVFMIYYVNILEDIKRGPYSKKSPIRQLMSLGLRKKSRLILKNDMPPRENKSLAVVRLPDPKLKTLDERGIECIFVGYAEHSRAFRFYVIEPNDSVLINFIVESMDAIYDENRFSSAPRPSLKIPNGTKDIGGSVVLEEDYPNTFDEAMKSQDVDF
ncbi:hypothetical protein Tco_1504011 [Tanacetum coccineum]